MKNYSAINIGPIYKTITMARKPRGLWAASYLFSLLMKCIIEQMPKDKIISPAVVEDMRTDVGLFPDRLFIEGDINANGINKAITVFAEKTGLSEDTVRGYFNIMHVTIDADTIAEAIKNLNNKLDCMELFERATDSDDEQTIIDLISMNERSPLFKEAFGKSNFRIEDLKDIASNERKDNMSYNDYFCIVQADGDNMGKIISSPGTNIHGVSKSLLDFGTAAVNAIKKFANNSLPIYAGGDDLLFIVPVVGNDDRNVMDLLKDIDDIYADKVKSMADNNDVITTMSYGLAICYYKYPLYEALETARGQLFGVAKNVEGKNAIAIDLRKHSGGSFSINFTKNRTDLYEAFGKVIEASGESEAVVSAVAHKIRSNEDLLGLWLGKDSYKKRNLNFFKKYMEYSEKDDYKHAALNLLNTLFANVPEQLTDAEKIEWIIQNMYGMLRTAKFMKGEDSHE